MSFTESERAEFDKRMSGLITQNRQVRQEFANQFTNQILKSRTTNK